MSEAQIIVRAKNGDTAAFSLIFDRYKDFVWNVAYRMTGDFDEAEDMAQDVFLTVWRSLSGFRGDSAFSTWLYRITVNRTLNAIRSKRASVSYTGDVDYGEAGGGALVKNGSGGAAGQVEAERTLARLLGALDPERRMVVILRELLGLDYKEIAEATGTPVGTVRSRLSRARADLSAMAERMGR